MTDERPRPRSPRRLRRRGRRRVLGGAAALLLVSGGLAAVLADAGPSTEGRLASSEADRSSWPPEGRRPGGPFAEDFAPIGQAPPREGDPEPGPDASTGRFTVDCGVNENGLRNSENVIVAPGVPNGAQHTHDYVGNQDVDRFTDDVGVNNAILARGETTCAGGDRSMHYWPVLRDTTVPGDDADRPGGGLDGNVGRILTPSSVTIEFLGNARGPVVAMPEFLQIITGNARAATQEGENANARWTCTGFGDRAFTDRYPLCPEGSDVVRVFDFPSCWDGEGVESADNRSHIVFPEEDGGCPDGFTAVPRLRQTLVYEVPDGPNFAVDGFPEERHDPITDHSDHINVMPRELMADVVDCLNGGLDCSPSSSPGAVPRPYAPTWENERW
ncbi:DUF1996 domain-containing protein [Nocardiopsis sp. EMB25]|uniref:DUF1996 domain-containing protein n=1 Tax=Nocardiopsis sp. EMB25 TaxID=2835867 RepID=UPI0022849EA9|nr:DUF1996 domain-containing protein [Nocardiopsis sp. EMB25]MCY9785973.1 DUF1996 domain-containing protein [Nocardiopsis sp. EMB25]